VTETFGSPEQRGERVYELFQKGTALLDSGDFAAAAIPLEQAREPQAEVAAAVLDEVERLRVRSAREAGA